MTKWMLGSPFHIFLSSRMMLVTFTGRKSGKSYTTPLNYVREGNTIWVVSRGERTWWRNLRGGAPVILRLRGQDQPATGEAVEDPAMVSEYLRRLPRYAKYFEGAVDKKGRPRPARRSKDLSDRVVVRFRLR